MNIQLVRIDDRLIHGQVVIGWAGYLNTNQIILCEDSIAENDWEKELYLSIVPEHIKAKIMKTTELAEYIINSQSDLHKTIILVNSPKVIERLIQLGVPIEKVNVGGIHFKEGRKKLLNYLYLNEDEIESFRRCIKHGVEFDCQDIPLCKRTPLRKLIQ
ncbi:MAG: PTS sugar transporter subunit IIB [Calditrichaceae bacterium]|jgi:mannose/fructose/N-acetylgalactosamine-specific phosphotransferase system component IIB